MKSKTTYKAVLNKDVIAKGENSEKEFCNGHLVRWFKDEEFELLTKQNFIFNFLPRIKVNNNFYYITHDDIAFVKVITYTKTKETFIELRK